jgi:hypothetical protein
MRSARGGARGERVRGEALEPRREREHERLHGGERRLGAAAAAAAAVSGCARGAARGAWSEAPAFGAGGWGAQQLGTTPACKAGGPDAEYGRATGRGNSREGGSECTVGRRLGATVGRGGRAAPAPTPPAARPVPPPATQRPMGERGETCPVSTEGWTRRAHFVREAGEGGGGGRTPRPVAGPWATAQAA